MPLPKYVAPGESYVTPEMVAANSKAALDAANAANPSGANLTSQLVGNLSGGLHGELPNDVRNLIQQQAAQNGVANGVGGSDFANYQGLRTLGLTSLSRMQHTEDSLVNPLLGYRPVPYAQPHMPTPAGPPPPQGSGGFGNTTPHYNVGPIGGGGGAPHATLPTYGAPQGGTSTGNILNDLLAKYGPIGNSGSSPMGTYGGPPLDMTNLGGGGYEDQGYGYGNDQDYAQTSAGGYGADYAGAADAANLGYDPSDFGYSDFES